jgi:deoxyribose-phosphate aldolase
VLAWHIGCYCVQPCWAALAARSLEGTSTKVASVIGFPHGADRSDVKASATALAVVDGAGEIDMVQNFGALRSGVPRSSPPTSKPSCARVRNSRESHPRAAALTR